MILSKKLLYAIIIIHIISGGVFAYLYLSGKLPPGDAEAIIWGWGITGFNFALAFFLIYKGFKKKPKLFITYILGGMTLRMFLTLGMVIICLQTLEINQNSFIFSIFIFYLLYLIIEILHLNSIKE